MQPTPLYTIDTGNTGTAKYSRSPEFTGLKVERTQEALASHCSQLSHTAPPDNVRTRQHQRRNKDGLDTHRWKLTVRNVDNSLALPSPILTSDTEQNQHVPNAFRKSNSLFKFLTCERTFCLCAPVLGQTETDIANQPQ